MEDAAELSLFDHLLGKGQRRHAPVVVPDHVGDARALHRLDHAPRLGERASERFLARHHLAGLRGGDSDLGMRVIGTGDVDKIDVVAPDQFAPVGLMRAETPLGGKIPRLGFVARADSDQLCARFLGKEAPHLMIGIRMGTAHEAGTHEPNPQAPVRRHFIPQKLPERLS